MNRYTIVNPKSGFMFSVDSEKDPEKPYPPEWGDAPKITFVDITADMAAAAKAAAAIEAAKARLLSTDSPVDKVQDQLDQRMLLKALSMKTVFPTVPPVKTVSRPSDSLSLWQCAAIASISAAVSILCHFALINPF